MDEKRKNPGEGEILEFPKELRVEHEPALRTYRFSFDQNNRKLGLVETPFESSHLGAAVADWVNRILAENGFHYPDEPGEEREPIPSYYVAELARNALEFGDHTGTIEVTIQNGELRAVITNGGQGFEGHPQSYISASPDHGLDETIRHADGLSIESYANLYEKKGNRLVRKGKSDVVKGTRVTFVKKLGLLK